MTGETFLVEVQQRDVQTLLPIIRQYIRPGSVVYSDEWRAYSQLQSHTYSHPTVNHSRNFVDPVTGSHSVQRECGVLVSRCYVKRKQCTLPCSRLTYRSLCGDENLTASVTSHSIIYQNTLLNTGIPSSYS